MSRFITKRLLGMLLVAFLASIVLFVLFMSLPGDRSLTLVDPNIATQNPELYQQLLAKARESLGLDLPLPAQYFLWIKNMLTGNFGYSIAFKKPVLDVVRVPLANTIRISVVTLITTYIIAIPLGIVTAVKKNSLFDRTVQTATAISYSMPPLVIYLVVIYIFAIRLGWFPVSGMSSINAQSGIAGILDSAKHMFLPVLSFVLMSLASITRYLRGSMIEVLNQDYIRTARAKGLSEKTVIYVHAFRNAMIPLITILTGSIIGIFSGSMVMEKIFAWNGIGLVTLNALNNRDFNVSLFIVMVTVVISLVAFLIMDLVYMIVDPRIRME